jgi:hypothetical protein
MHIRSAQFKNRDVDFFESELEIDCVSALKYFFGDVLSITDATLKNRRVLLINDEPFIVVYNTDKRYMSDISNMSVLYANVHSNRITFAVFRHTQNLKLKTEKYFSLDVETPNLFSTDDAMQLRYKFIDNSLGNKRFVKQRQSFSMTEFCVSEQVDKAILSIEQIDALAVQFGVECSVPVEKATLSIEQIDALAVQFEVECSVDYKPVDKEVPLIEETPVVQSEVESNVVEESTRPVKHAADLKKMTRPELISLCKERNIKKYSKLKKEELVSLLSSL